MSARPATVRIFAPDDEAERPSRVFHRFPAVPLPRAAKGDGPYIVDDRGRRYLDASSGAAVSCLGHSHPAVIRAVRDQVGELAFAHTGFFTSDTMEELAELLTENASGELERVYFVSGGSEGIEAALKMARQFFVEIGEPKRSKIVARRQSYHGNTLGALGAGGNLWRRGAFEPLLVSAIHVSLCYAYRDRRDEETEAEYGRRLADELDAAIREAGPETVMCFLAETVAGATLGAVPPVEGYLAAVREACDRHGVLLILDEVMCGMGRTGTLHACKGENVVPDILVVAKGLGAGYQPIGAVLVARRVYDAMVAGSGFFQHGHTYTGHLAACAGALAVQKAICDENLLDNVRRRGSELGDALTERFGNHRHIGDIRGRGLFFGLEFVADRASKRPFEARHRIASRLKYRALENGLICYPMGGVIDGREGDHVILAPPFIIDGSHIAEIVDKLDRSVAQVLAEVGC